MKRVFVFLLALPALACGGSKPTGSCSFQIGLNDGWNRVGDLPLSLSQCPGDERSLLRGYGVAP